jgi:adenosylcobinamide-GDP ribazoletransferase
MDGLKFAIGTLTVFPVRVERVDRAVAGRAMMLAPLVGALLGIVVSVPLAALNWLSGPGLLAPALAVGALALLTRGLHLDGLADLADGLGSGKPAPQALEIMRRSDIGPFGVVTLLCAVLIQVTALAETATAAVPALVTACVTGRLALTWACRDTVPAARPGGLGAMVAGTVRRSAALGVTAIALLAVALAGYTWTLGAPPIAEHAGYVMETRSVEIYSQALPAAAPGPPPAMVLPGAALAGLAVSWPLLRRARRRLGGITGDVLGALVEVSAATTLVICAVLL